MEEEGKGNEVIYGVRKTQLNGLFAFCYGGGEGIGGSVGIVCMVSIGYYEVAEPEEATRKIPKIKVVKSSILLHLKYLYPLYDFWGFFCVLS